jgi:hypothetical protein
MEFQMAPEMQIFQCPKFWAKIAVEFQQTFETNIKKSAKKNG